MTRVPLKLLTVIQPYFQGKSCIKDASEYRSIFQDDPGPAPNNDTWDEKPIAILKNMYDQTLGAKVTAELGRTRERFT